MAKVKLPGGTPLPPAVLAALETAIVDAEAGIVKLTTGQLPRDEYELVDEVMRRIGGKWKGGKTMAHVFPPEAIKVWDYWISQGAMPPDNPEAFYETPPDVVQRAMDLAMDAFPYKYERPRILEPSAGNGALARAAVDYYADSSIVAVESNPVRCNTLRGVLDEHAKRDSVRVVQHDFLSLSPVLMGRFDLILMNPPFRVEGRPEAWLDHVQHARKFLAPDGRLVAIVPASIGYASKKAIAALRDELAEVGGHSALPPDSFKAAGTGVNTALIYINAPEDESEGAARPEAAEPPPPPRLKPSAKPAPATAERPADLVVTIYRYRGKLVFPGNWPGAVEVGSVELPANSSPRINGKENRLYFDGGPPEGFRPGGLLVAARSAMFGITTPRGVA